MTIFNAGVPQQITGPLFRGLTEGTLNLINVGSSPQPRSALAGVSASSYQARCTVRVASRGLRFGFINGGDGASAALPGVQPISVKASIIMPNAGGVPTGTPIPLTFNGGQSSVIIRPTDPMILTDPFNVDVLAGSGLSVLSFVQVSASLATGTANAAITWTAVIPGSQGANITVALVNPGTSNAALSIVVTGTAIVVNLATNGVPAITSTAGQIVQAILQTPAAAALVTPSLTTPGSNTGASAVTAVAATALTWSGSVIGHKYGTGGGVLANTDNGYEGVDAGNDDTGLTNGLPNPKFANGYVYGPVTVIATPSTPLKPYWALYGDSILKGAQSPVFSETAGLNGQTPFSTMAYINTAIYGEFAAWAANPLNRISRGPLLNGVTHLLSNYGTNDEIHTSGLTLAQLQGYVISFWQIMGYRSIRCFHTTLPPNTTSTDSFATTVNQTKAALAETTRVSFNQWLRAGAPVTISGTTITPVAVGTGGAITCAVYNGPGVQVGSGSGHPLVGVFDMAYVVETSVFVSGGGTDSGLWVVNGTTFWSTGDGTHPSSNAGGYAAIATAMTSAGFPWA